jgi:protoporphyrinogen oxidase
MAWLWSKLTLRRQIKGQQAREELLGYPRGSFETLYRELVARIVAAGGRVLIDRPAAAIDLAGDGPGYVVTPGAPDSFRRGLDPREFATEDPERYDAVVATVPSDTFSELLEPDLAAALGPDYLEQVRGAEYHTALCVLLEVDRQVTDAYWTNVCDEDVPFIGLVEHTNLLDPSHYGGRRFLYIANYVEAGDPLLAHDTDALLDAYDDGLRRIVPGWSRDWIRRAWRFAEPAAQPIVTAGYRERMPALQTPCPGLVLANTTQVYPEDRGTNYAVRLGDAAAVAVCASPAEASTPVA